MILLGILKWIGLVLLWIGIVLLVLLLYFLFFPWTYRLQLKATPKEKFFKGYLFGFIHFWKIKVKKFRETDWKVQVASFFGLWQLYPKKNKEKRRPDIRKRQSKKTIKKEILSNTQTVATEDNREMTDTLSREKETSEQAVFRKRETEKKTSGKKRDKGYQREKKSAWDLKKIISFLKQNENKEAIHFALQKFVWLLKRMKPVVSNANATFSTGEPDITGKVLGLLCVFPPVYQKSVHIYPDFTAEEPYFEGEMTLHGKIRIYQIVYVIFSLFFHKSCRHMLQKILQDQQSFRR